METDQSKKELSRIIAIPLQGNNYTIEFPNVGQFIEIETMKVSLSSGVYRSLVSLRTFGGNLALDYVDAISTFSVLIPQLRKDLKIDSLLNLNPIEAKEITKVYKDIFLPWYSEWMKLLKEEEEIPEVPESPETSEK